MKPRRRPLAVPRRGLGLNAALAHHVPQLQALVRVADGDEAAPGLAPGLATGLGLGLHMRLAVELRRVARRAVVVLVAAPAAGQEPPEQLVEDGAQQRRAGHEDDDARLGGRPRDDAGDRVGEVVEVKVAEGEEAEDGEDDGSAHKEIGGQNQIG